MKTKKLFRILSHKRIQGALAVLVVGLLKVFGVEVGQAELSDSIYIIIGSAGALWHIWGNVDAAPGHGRREV